MYRSDVQGENFVKLNSEPLTASEYNDTKAPSGQFSYYRVSAVDEDVNESKFALESAKMPDIVAPEATIDSGPQGTVNKANAAFEFSADENGSTFECKLDGGSFENCASPKEYTGLGDGEHTFTVLATDAANNTSEPASRTWTVDTEAPAKPASFTADGSLDGIALDWADNSEQDLAGYNIYRRVQGEEDFTQLNSEPLNASEYNDADAPAGDSYYRVKAVDKVGNESIFALESATRPAPGSAPATPKGLTATPSQKGIALDWTDNNENDLAGYNVSRRVEGEDDWTKLNNELLDKSEYLDTKAPIGKTSYYRVTAVDNGDNESDFAADGAKRVDETVPNTSITDGPKDHVKSRSASFAFESTEENSTFECKLDGGSFENCSSPETYSNLSEGRHVFRVRATDIAGNIDSSAARRIWTVDTKGPRVYKLSPRRVTRDRTPTVRATVEDAQVNLAKRDIKLYFDGKRKKRFSYNRRTDELSYNTGRLAKKRHTVKIVAVDRAGNRTVKVWRFRVR